MLRAPRRARQTRRDWGRPGRMKRVRTWDYSSGREKLRIDVGSRGHGDNGTPASLMRASAYIYGCAQTVDHYSRCEPDRASALAHSATGLAVVATAVLSQHDATPKVTRRHA